MERYQPQLQWICEVAGTNQIALSMIFGANEPLVEMIPFAPDYAAEMVKRGEQFMDFVRRRIPPVSIAAVESPVVPIRIVRYVGQQSMGNQCNHLARDAAKCGRQRDRRENPQGSSPGRCKASDRPRNNHQSGSRWQTFVTRGVEMNDDIPVYGLVPQSMAEAMKLADHMADAKLVPAALQKSAADCLLVIEQATRWQMSPFAVAQECSVIQGKIMYSGKLVAAVVNSRGNLQNRLSYSYDGDGESRVVTVSGRLQGEIEPRTVSVILRNARTANKVWTTQPDQQLGLSRRQSVGAQAYPRTHARCLLARGVRARAIARQRQTAAKAGAQRTAAQLETGEIEDTSPVLSPDVTREGAPGSSDDTADANPRSE